MLRATRILRWGNFLLPDLGWQPPYPYTHADFIIEAEEEGALNR